METSPVPHQGSLEGGKTQQKPNPNSKRKLVLLDMLNTISISGISWLYRQGQQRKQLQVAQFR